MRNRFLILMVLGLCSVRAEQRSPMPAVVNPSVRSPWRATLSLDGAWELATDTEKLTIQVPGCWEAQGVGGPGMSKSFTPERATLPLRGSYVGTAWYRKTVTIPADWSGRQVWLKLGGVHAQGWLYVNDRFVATNATYCGTYKYNITGLVQPGQPAAIAIQVRNDVPSRKGLMGWVHRFGGLYRSVELEATPAVWIDDAHVVGDFDNRRALVHVKIGGPVDARYRLTVGKSSTNAAAEVVIPIALDPFQPWSPETPHLYRADIVLERDGKPVDGWSERFGVRKWEVRGTEFYLNNRPYFIRGFGDDYIYPLTLCSPASRDEHRKHLQLAKDYGFNYVRHHTHCEVPEFYEAADEVGIMVQPELPYYGARPSAGVPEMFFPKEDLAELITHYRRYVSLATYCTGNEGHLGSPIDAEIYQLAKRLDPTRLVLHQDGGKNTPENSDFDTAFQRARTPTRPYVAHEYLNLATHEDPRLAGKYTGAQGPLATPEKFREQLAKAGLSWEWGVATLDAGNQLQRIYQKRGLEHARREGWSGAIFWTIADVGTWAAQGLFNQFWEPKLSLAEYFRQFNSPTVIVAKFTPDEQVFAAGDELRVEWVVSAFEDVPTRTVAWKLLDGATVLQVGDGNASIKIPAVTKPVRARLAAELAGTSVRNSWDLWLFPRVTPAPAADVLVTKRLDHAAVAALEAGKSVVLLGLPGIAPGVKLGWWNIAPQAGTAVARHPAFGDFPHDGYVSEVFFRLLGRTIVAGDPVFRDVEPLMVGRGRVGYLIHVFQAKAGNGKLLATGLDLQSDHPEAAYLLHQLVEYAHSDRFQPTGTLDLATARPALSFDDQLNGWRKTVHAAGGAPPYMSYIGSLPMAVARQLDGKSQVIWRTAPVPANHDVTQPYTFRWVAGLGYITQPAGGRFTLSAGQQALVEFDVTLKSQTWKSADGRVELKYTVRLTQGPDSSGVMELTLPGSLVTAGKEVELRVTGSASNSRRWFGLYEFP